MYSPCDANKGYIQVATFMRRARASVNATNKTLYMHTSEEITARRSSAAQVFPAILLPSASDHSDTKRLICGSGDVSQIMHLQDK